MDTKRSVLVLFPGVLLVIVAITVFVEFLPILRSAQDHAPVRFDVPLSSNVSADCSCPPPTTRPSRPTQPTQPTHPTHPTQPTQPVTAVSTDQLGKPLPMIFIVTPTYKRITQKADLTRMCQTLMLVKQVKWIVIEDSVNTTDLVTHLLANCAVDSVHLNHRTMVDGKGHRGVGPRNKGLQWILDHVAYNTTKGVIYMGDDDNAYDIRLFEEMRYTNKVSIWPVSFAGGLLSEGPKCKDGKVIEWGLSLVPNRTFPIDMAAFAVGLKYYGQHKVKFNSKAASGYLETDFIEALKINQQDLEAKANDCTKVYVWHTKTCNPDAADDKTDTISDIHIEI